MKKLSLFLTLTAFLFCAGNAAWGQVPGWGAQVPSAAPQVGLGTPTAPTTASGNFNLSATNLLHWRKAVSNVRNGLGRGRVVVIGDSTSMASGAGTGGTLDQNAAYPNGWVAQFAKLLNTYVPSVFQSIYYSQGVGVTYPTYDTRVTMGANWSLATTGMSGTFFQSTGAINNLTFTPTAQFDTIVVTFASQLSAGRGDAAINVDGGTSLGTINCNQGFALRTATFTVTKGTHTINIVPNNDGILLIAGIQVYDSTTSAIDIFQTAKSGAKAADFTASTNPWDPINNLESLAPDLTIICLTINDSNAPTDLGTYQTQMQTIITAAKASGDVLLVVGPPSNTSNATNGTLANFVAVNRALAVANNAPLVDLSTRWVSYAVTNPVMPYFDTLHPETLAYGDEALAVFQALSMMGSQ